MIYSDEELRRRKINAAAEAKEMFRRSGFVAENCPSEKSCPPENTSAQKAQGEKKNEKEKSEGFSLSSFLSSFLSGKDSDGIIIIFLIYLLIREKADKEIILALIYILL